MEKQKFYVPILKWKAGEEKALSLLSDDIKSNIRPLIKLLDFEPTKRMPNMQDYLTNIIEDISNSLNNTTFLLDFEYINHVSSLSDGQHPLIHCLSVASQNYSSFIPVISSYMGIPYINALKTALLENNKIEICLKITDADFEDVNSFIDNTLNLLSISKFKVHLLIDNKYISPSIKNTKKLSAESIINNIKDIHQFNSVTLCGTSIPNNISEFVEVGSIDKIPRLEYDIWSNLLNKTFKDLQFGDYTSLNPELIEFDPVKMTPSAKIIYTSDKDFVFFRGRSTKKHGYEQFYTLSEQVIDSDYYCGEHFSYGDKFIYDCAIDCKHTGNLTTWITVAVNHHITFVVRQLSNLSYF